VIVLCTHLQELERRQEPLNTRNWWAILAAFCMHFFFGQIRAIYGM
jgi:hypothetical protein